MSRRISTTRGLGLGDAKNDWKLPTPIDPQQFGADDEDGDNDKESLEAGLIAPSLAATGRGSKQASKPKAAPVTFQQQQQQQPELSHPPATGNEDSVTMDQDGLLKPSAAAISTMISQQQQQQQQQPPSNLLPSKRPFSAAVERPNNPQQEQHFSSIVSVSTKSSQSTNASTLSGDSYSSGTNYPTHNNNSATVAPNLYPPMGPPAFGAGAGGRSSVFGGTVSVGSIGGSALFPQNDIMIDRVGQQQQQQLPPHPDDPSVVSLSTGVSSLQTTSTASLSHQQPMLLDPNYKIVPKSELHVVYAKQFKKILSNANYHTWHNAVEAHQLKWTSVFVCPKTAELFLSGRYPGALSEQMNGLWWYTKKSQAEHAAAARVLDCLFLRNSSAQRVGSEQPYTERQALFRMPPVVPEPLRITIAAQQTEIRRENQLPPLV